MSALAKTFTFVTLASLSALGAVGCSVAAEEDVGTGEDDVTSTTTIATCKTGSVETFDTIKLEARFAGGRLQSLSSAATDYRGVVRLDASGVQKLSRGGAEQLVAFGQGTADVRENGSPELARRALMAIVIDPAAREVRLTAPSDGTGEILETHTACTFQGLERLQPFGAPLVERQAFEHAYCEDGGRLDLIAERREGEWEVVGVRGTLVQNPGAAHSVAAEIEVDIEPAESGDVAFRTYGSPGGAVQKVAIEHFDIRANASRKVDATFQRVYLPRPDRPAPVVRLEYTDGGGRGVVEAKNCTFKNLGLLRN
jgi:hypothetical protein